MSVRGEGGLLRAAGAEAAPGHPELGWGGGRGRGRDPQLPPQRCLAPSRLQEEMLQREEAENTLQSFRQVCGGRREGAVAEESRRWAVVPGTGGWGCRSLLSSHKGIPSVLTQTLLVFFRGMLRSEGRGGGGNYCLALSKSSLVYKKRSDVESLSDPIKVKGGPSARLAEGY